MPACICSTCLGALRGQESELDPLELELQAFMRCLTSTMGAKLWRSAGAANHQAISPASCNKLVSERLK